MAWMPRTTPHPPVPQESGGYRTDTSTTLRRVSDKTPLPTLVPPLLRCNLSGCRAMNQLQPCRLCVFDKRDPVQQRLVFNRQHLQMRSDEIGVPQRGPKNLDATPMRRLLVRSPPHNGCFLCDYCCHLQLVASKRFLASLIPHLGFPLVHSNSSLAPQSCFEQ